MTREFSGSVMLPTALAVKLDCLGQGIEGTTGDHSFKLTFPRQKDAEDFLVAPEFHEPQWLDDDDDNPRFWGIVNRDFSAAVVTGMAIWLETTALAARTSTEVTTTYVEEVFPRVFTRWLSQVSTMLELWAGQGVQLFHGFRAEGPAIVLFDHNADYGYNLETATMNAREIVGRSDPAWRLLSLTDWQTAARLVSAGDSLDVVWQMFNRAQQMARTEQRFAVIEACTAVEVAVGRRVTESLFGYPKEARDQILTNAGGLIGLVKLHDRLFPRGRTDKRPDFSNHLAKLRNDVAHGGKIPDDAEVDNALAAARYILDEVCPFIPADQPNPM